MSILELTCMPENQVSALPLFLTEFKYTYSDNFSKGGLEVKFKTWDPRGVSSR